MNINKRTEMKLKRMLKLWSQAVLALEAGCSQAQINRVECGLLDPNKELAAKLCELLELPADYFERTSNRRKDEVVL